MKRSILVSEKKSEMSKDFGEIAYNGYTCIFAEL